MHVILPKERPSLDRPPLSSLPLFFLAGPIQGTGDWHQKMTELLQAEVGDCIIVNPSRYDDGHPHHACRLRGPVVDERQTDWERYYLSQAGCDWPAGCIIFWLAQQTHERDDGEDYGRDTRGELGEWRGHLMHDPNVRVVFGVERNDTPGRDEYGTFRGLGVIERNFIRAVGPGFRFYETMEEVVQRAVFLTLPQLSLVSC